MTIGLKVEDKSGARSGSLGKLAPSRPVDAKQLPPVANGVENPNNGHALGSRFVRDQEVVELSDPPFANGPQLRSPQRKSGAHLEFNTRMEHDKSLLTLSTAAIGVLIALASKIIL